MDIDGAPVAQIIEDAPAVSSKEEEMDIDALTQGGGGGGRVKTEGGRGRRGGGRAAFDDHGFSHSQAFA